MAEPELKDMQGLVRNSYRRFKRAAYRLLEIDPSRVAAAKDWLAALLEAKWIDRADQTIEFRIRQGEQRYAAAIAFTPWGLCKLGFPKEALSTFVSEFQEGIFAEHRSRLLGDICTSSPGKWDWGKARKEDILLMVYGIDMPDLQKRVHEIEQILDHPAVVGQLIGKFRNKEPFGFADGIAQPFIEGISRDRPADGERPVKIGEFVLGYPNEFDQFPASPSIAVTKDPDRILPRVGASGRADFGRNGSFLVLRQLAQNVTDFQAIPGADQARMVGRWKNGAPLVRHDTEPGRDYKEIENDFGYHHEDRYGFRCPIGAHIRRANPRDSLADGAGITPHAAQALVNQHRIIRRGRVYESNGETGLLFLCLNANIERQFEFIQQNWIMSPEFGGLHDETDPLLGNVRPDGPRAMTIQNPRFGERLTGLDQFVTVKGGGYFFLPGMTALRYLSN